jgi:hypothetical protein
MYYKNSDSQVDLTREDVDQAIVDELERIDSENMSQGTEEDEERSLESAEDEVSSDSEKKIGYMSLEDGYIRYEGELVALCREWTREYNITCNVTNI